MTMIDYNVQWSMINDQRSMTSPESSSIDGQSTVNQHESSIMTHHVTAKKYAIQYLLGILTNAFLLCSLGCLAKPENEVVVYAALDRDFSQPILQSIFYARISCAFTSSRDLLKDTLKVGRGSQRKKDKRKEKKCNLKYHLTIPNH